jgi:hypothetical protein
MAQVGGTSHVAGGVPVDTAAGDDASLAGSWCKPALVRLGQLKLQSDVPLIRQIAEEAEARAANAQAPEAKAFFLVVAGAARTSLYSLHTDRKSNGTQAFAHFKDAFDLAPELKEAATGFGQTVLKLGTLGFGDRTFLSLLGIGVDKDQGKRVIAALAAFPEDPLSQLLRGRLAAWCKDNKAAAEAAARVKALKEKSPDSRAQVEKWDAWLTGLEKHH